MELIITSYLSEILAVTTVAILMAVLPGADFVLVTRTSIRNGRLAGLYSTLGVCLSICIHASYSIAGLAVIIANSTWFFISIKYLGATYLIYIAWQLLTTRDLITDQQSAQAQNMPALATLRLGFTCNMLNPKAPLFFMSIFTQVVSVNTPIMLQLSYGLIIMLAHLIWFSSVALLLSHPSLLPRFNQHKRKIDKLAGMALLLIAIKLTLMSSL
ncbi:LysE family translocator [Psychromonas sp. KJ10-10]|uniref:LysE family translocator n=1 Tax=Psychromonas sp. KJ10-10 TaxID=3391823 RepID=UPI0039B5C63B